MRNAIATWFQDWADACTYARECAPDLSFVTEDPIRALLGIGFGCFVVWAVNERSLSRRPK